MEAGGSEAVYLLGKGIQPIYCYQHRKEVEGICDYILPCDKVQKTTLFRDL